MHIGIIHGVLKGFARQFLRKIFKACFHYCAKISIELKLINRTVILTTSSGPQKKCLLSDEKILVPAKEFLSSRETKYTQVKTNIYMLLLNSKQTSSQFPSAKLCRQALKQSSPIKENYFLRKPEKANRKQPQTVFFLYMVF